MLGLLILLFTLIPALELYLLFIVGAKIGGLNTILLIVTTGILGATLAKSQGMQVLSSIQHQANKGELPGDQIIQALMILVGGVLLLTPGIITDVFGFSLVIPGTRHILMSFIKKLIHNSIQNGNFRIYGVSAHQQGFDGEKSFYSYSHYSYDDDKPNVVEVDFTKKE